MSRAHVTIWPAALQVHPIPVALWNATFPDGNRWVTLMPVASSPPSFVTSIVYVSVELAATGTGASLIAIDRSAPASEPSGLASITIIEPASPA